MSDPTARRHHPHHGGRSGRRSGGGPGGSRTILPNPIDHTSCRQAAKAAKPRSKGSQATAAGLQTCEDESIHSLASGKATV